MVKRLLLLIFLSVLLTIPANLSAQDEIDSLYKKLAVTTESADSINILYHILDISPYKDKGAVLEKLYYTARQAGDYDAALDAIRQQSNYSSLNDSLQKILIQRIESIPESENQKRTRLFVNVRGATVLIRRLPEAERQAKLNEILSKHKATQHLDTYQRIEYLFYLCAFLRSITDGDLLIKYFQELQELIDSLPSKDLTLRALFYIQAATAYVNNGLFAKAIDANLKLIDIIEQLQRSYKQKGRTRNYDVNYYFCYLRLLRCYSELEAEEIDIYYNRILSLLDKNPEIKKHFEDTRQATIYYLMAKERYKEVIPLIEKQIPLTGNRREDRRYLVEAMIKAAEAAGDDRNLLNALKINNDILIDRIRYKAAESYKELQTIYEVNELKQQKVDMDLHSKTVDANRHRQFVAWSFAGFVIVICLLMIVLILYRRSKHLSRNLRKINLQIAAERDSLKQAQAELILARDKAKAADWVKTDFVNNISHELRTPLAAIVEYSRLITDCADEERQPYMTRFADIVSLNVDLLLTLVNDVLNLASLENSKMTIKTAPASVNEICLFVLDNIRKHINKGVNLIFTNQDQPDITIDTDRHRIEQILLNLLTNAAKFTVNGSITLAYREIDEGANIEFTVTDTGIGIPRGKEEVIFSRFEKLNPMSQGNGLGLYIGRLMAELLKGRLYLDTEYRKGARFVLIVPTEFTANEKAKR